MADEGRADAANETVNTTNEMAGAPSGTADAVSETSIAAGEMAGAAHETARGAGETGKSAEPCWGPLMPLLTAGFCPAKTARRTDHLGLVDTLSIHVLAWLVVFTIACCTFEPHTSSMMVLGMMLALLDAGYLVLAFVLTPWGARRERLGASFRRVFLRSLRHTPHVMQAFLLATLCAAPLFDACSAYRETRWEQVGVLQDALIADGMDYYEAWDEAYETVQSRYPFYIVYGEALGTAVYFAGGLWLLWGWLGAIGAAPIKPAAETDREQRCPLCEVCGYNLTGLSMEGRCPECGEPIEKSLGPDARPGTPWQRRTASGRWKAFWKTSIAALVRPTALGRKLIPSPDGPDHRVLMAFWCGCDFVIAWLGCLLCYFADTGFSVGPLDKEFLWVFCPIASLAVALAALLICIASAGVVGLVGSWKYKRNMLPATMQAASAAGGFGPLWLMAALAGGLIIIVVGDLVFASPGVSPFAVVFGVGLAFGPSLVCLVIYDWLIVKIARGARFANR